MSHPVCREATEGAMMKGKKNGLHLVAEGDNARHVEKVKSKQLEMYDASTLVGIRTIVFDAAVEHVCGDERSIELPKLPELLATVAVTRCLMPIALRGHEMKAMRKIMGLTLADLAKRLDGRTAPETVSRWESEAQPIGGYAEKVLRLLVCEELCKRAPGIEYSGAKIAHLRVLDPWVTEPEFVVPAIELRLVKLKEGSGTVIDAYANAA